MTRICEICPTGYHASGWGGGAREALAARVLVVGAGAWRTGDLVSCCCSIGTITIIDDDQYILSDLNRQIIYRDGNVEHQKSPMLLMRPA